jgi:hypothetical protein
MEYITFEHRFADIILNSDYELKKEIFDIVSSVNMDEVRQKFLEHNQAKLILVQNKFSIIHKPG